MSEKQDSVFNDLVNVHVCGGNPDERLAEAATIDSMQNAMTHLQDRLEWAENLLMTVHEQGSAEGRVQEMIEEYVKNYEIKI